MPVKNTAPNNAPRHSNTTNRLTQSPQVPRPECPVCGTNHHIRRNGTVNGRIQYHCVPCHRYFHDDIDYRAPKPPTPCPFCKSPCRKFGKTASGAQRYHCKACKRINVNLWPSRQNQKIGPTWRQFNFQLSPLAWSNLEKYAWATRKNIAQAVRAIFRTASRPHIQCGRYSEQTPRDLPVNPYPFRHGQPHHELPPLPSAAPDDHARKKGLPPAHPTIYTERKICVKLDEAAYNGLKRTSEILKINHQDAARYLCKTARIPTK